MSKVKVVLLYKIKFLLPSIKEKAWMKVQVTKIQKHFFQKYQVQMTPQQWTRVKNKMNPMTTR